MTKIEAEQLLELTDPYSKTDLRKAVRRAMMKWHPDRAASSGLDPQEASEKYGKISESERYLMGFFDGKPDDFRQSPSSTSGDRPSTGMGNDTGGTRSSSSRRDNTQTRRGNATNQATQQSGGGKQPTGNGRAESNASRPKPTPEPTPEEPTPSRTEAARPKPTPEEVEERRRRAAARRRARREASRPEPQPDPQPEPTDHGTWNGVDVPQDEEQEGQLFHAVADNAKLVKRAIVIVLFVLLFGSVEIAVKSVNLGDATPHLLVKAFAVPAVFLVATVLEVALSPITKTLCSALDKIGYGLDRGNRWAVILVRLVEITLGIAINVFRLLYKGVGWVLGYLLK